MKSARVSALDDSVKNVVAEAYYQLGLIYQKQKKEKEALNRLEQVFSRFPDQTLWCDRARIAAAGILPGKNQFVSAYRIIDHIFNPDWAEDTRAQIRKKEEEFIRAGGQK